MKHINTSANRQFFKVLLATRTSQAAMMTLRPGQSSSSNPENEHPRSEQWVYVISGTGRAGTRKRRVSLRAGSLLLIEKDESHHVVCSGRKPLITLNFYSPPAYTKSGELRE